MKNRSDKICHTVIRVSYDICLCTEILSQHIQQHSSKVHITSTNQRIPFRAVTARCCVEIERSKNSRRDSKARYGKYAKYCKRSVWPFSFYCVIPEISGRFTFPMGLPMKNVISRRLPCVISHENPREGTIRRKSVRQKSNFRRFHEFLEFTNPASELICNEHPQLSSCGYLRVRGTIQAVIRFNSVPRADQRRVTQWTNMKLSLIEAR